MASRTGARPEETGGPQQGPVTTCSSKEENWRHREATVAKKDLVKFKEAAHSQHFRHTAVLLQKVHWGSRVPHVPKEPWKSTKTLDIPVQAKAPN